MNMFRDGKKLKRRLITPDGRGQFIVKSLTEEQ